MATALITGGTLRIGREISLALAEKGFNIALHYNSATEETLNELTEEIRGKGVECEPFRCDFIDSKAARTLIKEVQGKLPDLELLVNNASIFEPSTIKETEETLFDAHFAINLKAPFFLSRDFARLVESGQIINITDTKITGDGSAYAAYLLTKKALADFTKMAAKEFAPQIRVNAVAPGLILPKAGKDPEYIDRLAQNIPLKRKGDPQDIAKAVCFFIENKYITGETIFVDGGEFLR